MKSSPGHPDFLSTRTRRAAPKKKLIGAERNTGVNIQSRIVNGEETSIESFPWQVAIRHWVFTNFINRVNLRKHFLVKIFYFSSNSILLVPKNPISPKFFGRIGWRYWASPFKYFIFLRNSQLLRMIIMLLENEQLSRKSLAYVWSSSVWLTNNYGG